MQQEYSAYKRKKIYFGFLLAILLFAVAVYSVCKGSVHLNAGDIINTFIYPRAGVSEVVIWNIRLPRIFAAVIAGMSLAVAGCIMQCVLRNPLASPFTMGISQGAAFGAAFAIIVLGLGQAHSPYIVTVSAFLASLISIVVILILSKVAGLSSQSMILAGIAMGTLFSSATMLLQYFAEDVKVASVIFWTFGDIGRAGRNDILVMFLAAIPALIYFISKRWDYNVLESGDETAKSLGLNTSSLRFTGVLIAALITSVSVAFLGIIGFIGLLAPHIMRRIVGGDYRILLPMSAIGGALLLLAADTISRTIIAPVVLPVGILTSFMGAPLFIYLILRKRNQYYGT